MMLLNPDHAGRNTLMQKSEDGDTVRRAHVNLAIDDHRGNELVASAEVVASIRRLAAVVEFVAEIGCVVSMQHSQRGVLYCPDNAVLCAAGADTRRCTRKAEDRG